MKRKITESLNSRILKYSLAAGAVLLGTKEADAQVWGQSVNQSLTNNSYTISFNGNNEFALKQSNLQTSFASSSTHVATGWITPLSDSAGWVISGSWPKPLSSKYVISAGKGFDANFKGSSDRFFRRESKHFFFNNTKSTTSSGSMFIGKGDEYIGVKFHLLDGMHYGWIEINVSSNGSILKVISYAYNQTAGTQITANGTLPVELTTFTANTANDKVELNWKTATEVNNYGFEIERRLSPTPSQGEGTSGTTLLGQWGSIGFVKGSGNSNSPKSYSFVDNSPLGGSAEYRLKQIDNDGSYKYSSIVTVNSAPSNFELSQNYPNPFNPTTTIKYAIPQAEHVTLKVYDEVGREVASLVNANEEAGSYSVEFAAGNMQLASGIYFYRITAGNFSEVKKLLLLK